MPELGDAIHDDEVNIGVLRRRRGSLTDEACIAPSYRPAQLWRWRTQSCRVVGVIWREWNEWKRAKLHNLEQQLAFAKLVRINAMHDEIMEIADDPILLKPDTKQVKHTREDGSEYETTEVVLHPAIGQCKGCPTPLPVLIEHVQRDPIGGDVAGLREPLDPQRVSELSG